MKILVNMPNGNMRDSFLNNATMEKLKSLGEVFSNDTNKQLTKEELCERIKDIDVIFVCWKSLKIDAEVMKHANRLKLVVCTAGSVAPFVSPELYAKGVRVISGNEMYAESVAEGVIAYILSYYRRLPFYMNELRIGNWNEKSVNAGLLGKTVGVISYGTISRYLIPLLSMFKVKIKIYSRSITDDVVGKYNLQRASIEEIVSTCDITTIQTALNEETYHMINKNMLAKVKEGSLFVNTARGNVVDEEALIEQLKSGRFNAILDVYGKEPIDSSSELLQLDNVMLMPHMAGPTYDWRANIGSNLADEIPNVLAGGSSLYEIGEDKAFSMSVNITK